MKKLLLSITVIGTLAMVSCGESEESTEDKSGDDKAKKEQKEESQPSTLAVDTEASKIMWHMSKKQDSTDFHEGLVSLGNGTVTVKDGKIVSGSFDIDMNTIAKTDEHGDSATFVTHMKSDKFFHVEEFPLATFQIKSVDGGNLTGDLTVMGVPVELTIPVEYQEISNDRLVADATFVVNRLDFGQTVMSPEDETPEEKQLNDEIEYTVHIEASK